MVPMKSYNVRVPPTWLRKLRDESAYCCSCHRERPNPRAPATASAGPASRGAEAAGAARHRGEDPPTVPCSTALSFREALGSRKVGESTAGLRVLAWAARPVKNELVQYRRAHWTLVHYEAS